jgi:hypothetical protein
MYNFKTQLRHLTNQLSSSNESIVVHFLQVRSHDDYSGGVVKLRAAGAADHLQNLKHIINDINFL